MTSPATSSDPPAERSAGARPLTRIDWALAGAGVALGLGAMAVDHLLGDDPGLEDPPIFLLSAAIILVIATMLFGRVVRRAHKHRRAGLIVALLSVASLPLIWLGAPFAVAPAAIALGLRSAGRFAIAAIGIGVFVLLLATGAYVYDAVDKLA